MAKPGSFSPAVASRSPVSPATGLTGRPDSVRVSISSITTLTNLDSLVSALTRSGVSAVVKLSGANAAAVKSAVARLNAKNVVSAAITLRGDTTVG